MAWLTRAVPIASNGFIAATRRNLASARTMPSRGTAISPSASTVIRTLSVSSGTRLNSSRYNSAPDRIARSSGPSVKAPGTYPSASTWAGSYCPIKRAGVSSALPSANTTDSPPWRAMSRSSVDLPVPGGPSITTCRPVASATVSTSRSRRSPTMGGARPTDAGGGPGSGGVMQDHAADVLAVEQVLISLVDLVKGVCRGDQFVQLQLTGLVELHHPRDVVERVAGAEQAPLDALLEQGQDRARQLDRGLGRVRQPGHHHGAALADRVERVRDHLGGDDPHRDDRRVGAHAPGQLGDQLLRLLGGRAAVRSAELLGRLALVGQRVDRDHVPGAGQRSPLDRVDADAADAIDGDGVTRLGGRGVHRRAETGRHPAADEHDLVQRQVRVRLDGGVLRDDRALGERAEHAHAAEVLAAAVEPVGAVGQAAVQDGGAHVTQVRLAGGAPPAVAADREERADDVVTGLQPSDARAGFLDDPGTLVAADDREARHDIAVAQVLVGVAEACCHVPDQDFTGLGGIEFQFGDLKVLARSVQDGGLGLHGLLLIAQAGAMDAARGASAGYAHSHDRRRPMVTLVATIGPVCAGDYPSRARPVILMVTSALRAGGSWCRSAESGPGVSWAVPRRLGPLRTARTSVRPPRHPGRREACG